MNNQIIATIETLLSTEKNIIVSVCGGSCTRKSTLVSTFLVDYFKEKCVLISQDQFQLQPSYIKNVHPDYKWDHPSNFGISQCYHILRKLKNNQTVQVPNYNFKKNEPITYKIISPKPIIIFEGLYTNYQDLQSLNDISIYVKSPWYARMTRRVFRNTLDRYKGREASSIVDSFSDSVTKAHIDFVKSQEQASNFNIETPLQFDKIIEYYNLNPINYSVAKNDAFLSIRCNENIIFKIENVSSDQFELLFFYNNLLYLKFNITTDLANKLKNINWLVY